MPGTVGTDALLNALTCHVVLMMPEWGGSVEYATRESTLPPSHVQKHKPGAARVNRDDRLCCRTCIHLMRSQHIRLEPRPKAEACSRAGRESRFCTAANRFLRLISCCQQVPRWRGPPGLQPGPPSLGSSITLQHRLCAITFRLPPVADMLSRNTHVSGLARGLLAASNITDDAHFTGPACSCPR
jgi:hypothetical protein